MVLVSRFVVLLGLVMQFNVLREHVGRTAEETVFHTRLMNELGAKTIECELIECVIERCGC
jgi:hypothetical protein